MTDTRARREIQALAEVGNEFAAKALNPHTEVFLSGLLTGLAMATRIHDGSTAEQQLDDLEARLTAEIGRSYVNGQPEPDAADDGPSVAECAANDVRWDLEKSGE